MDTGLAGNDFPGKGDRLLEGGLGGRPSEPAVSLFLLQSGEFKYSAGMLDVLFLLLEDGDLGVESSRESDWPDLDGGGNDDDDDEDDEDDDDDDDGRGDDESS